MKLPDASVEQHPKYEPSVLYAQALSAVHVNGSAGSAEYHPHVLAGASGNWRLMCFSPNREPERRGPDVGFGVHPVASGRSVDVSVARGPGCTKASVGMMVRAARPNERRVRPAIVED
jgi:hypothetical protein